jgi:hypothetical protein
MTFVEVSNIPRWRAVNSYATCTTRGLSHVSPQHRCITVFKQPVMKLSRCRIDVKHTTRCLRSVTHHVGDGSGCNTGRRKTNRASSYEALDMSVMRPDVWLRSLNSAHFTRTQHFATVHRTFHAKLRDTNSSRTVWLAAD